MDKCQCLTATEGTVAEKKVLRRPRSGGHTV